MNSITSPIDQIKSHVSKSREAEKNVTEGPWTIHNSELRDKHRKTIADFFTVSFSLKCEERERNIGFVASSRHDLPVYREALMILAEALEDIHFPHEPYGSLETPMDSSCKACDALNRAAKLLQP